MGFASTDIAVLSSRSPVLERRPEQLRKGCRVIFAAVVMSAAGVCQANPPAPVPLESELKEIGKQTQRIADKVSQTDERPLTLQRAAIGFGFIAAVTGVWSLLAIRHQLRLAALLEFTKRYAEVRDDLPENVQLLDKSFSMANLNDQEQSSALRSLRNFFFLYWIEHRSRRLGSRLSLMATIDHKLWSAWLESLRRYFEVPAVKEAWEIFQADFNDDGFVKEIVRKCLPKAGVPTATASAVGSSGAETDGPLKPGAEPPSSP